MERFTKNDSYVHLEKLQLTSRLKEIKKRRALRGKHPSADGLINSVGKRIRLRRMLLTPSFFYFFNPFFVSRNF